MASPNFLGSTTITGVTTVVSIANTNTSNVVLSNAVDSGFNFKITSIHVANSSTSFDVAVGLRLTQAAAGAGSSTCIINNVTIPPNSALSVIGRENPFYVEEDRSITIQANAGGYIDVMCSYEKIS